MATTRNSGKNARNIGMKIWVNLAEKEKILERAGDAPVPSWLRGLATGEGCDSKARKRGRVAKDKTAFAPLVIPMVRFGNQLSRMTEELKARDLTPEQVASISDQLAQIRKELQGAVKSILHRG